MMSTSPFKGLVIAVILSFSHFACAADSASTPGMESPTGLAHLLLEALNNSPAVASRRATASAAWQDVKAAEWQFYPTPGVSVGHANASKTDPTYQGDPLVAVAYLEQPLWTAGRLTANQSLANARSSISLAEIDLTRYDVARQTVEIYGSWLSSFYKTTALNAYLDVLTQRLEMLERRIAAGTSSSSDRMFALGRLELARVEYNTIQVSRKGAISRLTQLLGRPITDNELSGVKANVFTSPASLEELLDRALSNHPSLVRDEALIRQANAELKVAQAQQSPVVALRLERQNGNFSLPNLPQTNRALINVTSNFGAGLSVSNQIEGVRERIRAAENEQEASRRELIAQVTNDSTQFKSLPERITALKVGLRAADETVVSWDRQFTFGLKTWQDLLNAHRELQQARLAYIEAQVQAVVVGWRLAIQVQGPDEAIHASLGN